MSQETRSLTASFFCAAVGVSSSAGDSWWRVRKPGGQPEGGTIAVAADSSNFVWSPQNGIAVHYSTNMGSSRVQSSGIPAGTRVQADRVNPSTFYGFPEGTFLCEYRRWRDLLGLFGRRPAQ